MRVHLVHQSFPDYVLGLCRSLDEQVELDLTSVLSGSASPPRCGANIPHRVVHLPRFRSLRSPITAWRAVSRVLAEPTDVIHWQAAGNPWVDAVLALRRVRVPLVVTVHDMLPHPGDSSVLPGTFWAIYRLARRADCVIVHAEVVRDQAIQIGVRPELIRIVPHGELGSVFPPTVRKPSDTSTEKTVLFFGRVQGYKGLPDLIEAMPIVRESVPAAHLRIAGAGKSAESLVDQLRDDSHITFDAGFVPDERVPELFGASAVVVLPYREASQSGVAALAAGLGRAVVATRVGGLTEIVREDISGLLVEPNSPPELARAIVRLLTDASLRHRLERGAIAQAQSELSWQSIASTMAGLYSQVQLEGRSHEPNE